eukprot:CAMPEP_0198141406 /NCGR_PEP_ID=MMETSP1443-20131203/4423_1 /TAXON_ID=186043 /ORGANISM="Entomoneis sp., Strain CCMP2396" /LENGTH=480 /DNA_ID=CAMNT_0043804149 /DNA_START=156 /DNA_END=1598 /DNA_ORIENTATION=+
MGDDDVKVKVETSPAGTEEGTSTPAAKNGDFNMEARRRLKNEARVTSGIGKSKMKERNLEIFWNHIWPKLEEAGWTKIVLSGHREGSVIFLPKGSSVGEKGGMFTGEHYDRIRDVLDRLEEGRSQTEAAISNLYHSLQLEENADTTKSPDPRDRPMRASLLSPKLDLSWKEGGRMFPRKASKVGEEYQVAEFPKAGTSESSENAECVIFWDPKEASSLYDEDGELPLLEKVPKNKLESALSLLAELKYIPGDDFVETVDSMPARNGSDWAPEKKAKFSESVFKFRKDLHAVRAEMDIDMSTCLAHYYGIFKHTNDYRLVKTVLRDEKLDAKAANSAPAAGEPDACLICDDGGVLLICDGCEGEYHIECMDPALKSVPEGHWECDECVNQKLLAFRDYLVRQSGLFEAKDPEEDEGPVIYKPTPSALESVRKMAHGISALIAVNEEDEEMEDAGTPKRKAVKQEPKSTDSRKKRKSDTMSI